MTHTLVKMRVSQAVFDEIAERLRAAGYDHAFFRDGTISMHEIGIERDPVQRMPLGFKEVDTGDLSREAIRKAYGLDDPAVVEAAGLEDRQGKRTVGTIAHVDHGKTSLAAAIIRALSPEDMARAAAKIPPFQPSSPAEIQARREERRQRRAGP